MKKSLLRCAELNVPQIKNIIVLIFLISVSSKITAQAASFDCSKATTETELAICSDPELSSLDESLGLQWSKMSPIFPKSNQINWIERRDKCEINYCIKNEIEERIEFLAEINEIIDGHNILTCEVGQTIFSVNQDQNGIYILALTDNYFNRIDAEWNTFGSGVCRYFEYYGYDGTSEVMIEEEGGCSSGEQPVEYDLKARIQIGGMHFKCMAIND